MTQDELNQAIDATREEMRRIVARARKGEAEPEDALRYGELTARDQNLMAALMRAVTAEAWGEDTGGDA